MKKFLLFFALAATVLSVHAEKNVASSVVSENNEVTAVESVLDNATPAVDLLPAQQTDGTVDLSGTYFLAGSLYTSANYTGSNTCYKITVTTNSDGSYDLSGFFGTKGVVKGTFSNGELSIAAQQRVDSSATYGVVNLTLKTAATSYSASSAIKFKLDEIGNLVLSNGVGLTRRCPDYNSGKGVNLTPDFRYGDVKLVKCNGTITSDVTTSTTTTDSVPLTTPACVELNSDGSGVLYGVTTSGSAFGFVKFAPDAGGYIDFAVEPIYYHSTTYTYFYMTYAEYDKEDLSWYFYTSKANSIGFAAPYGVVNENSGELLTSPWVYMSKQVADSTKYTRVGNFVSGSYVKFTPKVATSVKDAGIPDDENVAPVYYNLQGIRVANPEKGVFIEVRGKKATKVIK